ncbi:uncharacterized protein A4U43_C02F14610 [Asparagus officinalis]|uniref:DUF632 domain-containing protein n=1 Tax=Asparagus officinalis TaxID=4686 RepID=A0A5P1FIA3_ASPOF|nr:uncharacterized protein A4U43_C02F14610 [Asparagus officinalis]
MSRRRPSSTNQNTTQLRPPPVATVQQQPPPASAENGLLAGPASESAHEVSKMLEATRMHYHSNFADNRGHIDHSARVMRAITWNRSCKGMKDENDGKDDFDNEELETHATILDKMLAWEKKLYKSDAGELMKIEYQRKVALLSKQKKRGSSHETLEKTKAAVSHLHTRYIVDMQSMDSTVSEINRLRDKQLYPKLVALVDG